MSYAFTTKSQVTLSKSVRDHLKVSPGDAVEFRIFADGSVRVLPAVERDRIDPAPEAVALARYRKLKGIGGQAGGSTDALMAMLRAHDEDLTDPGFAGVAALAPAPTADSTKRRRRK